MLDGPDRRVEAHRQHRAADREEHAFTGGANAPIAQGVKEGFTDSLLAATAVVSQPHPERKTVLIDANALLLTDIPVGERFTVGVHMRSYTFDARELELRVRAELRPTSRRSWCPRTTRTRRPRCRRRRGHRRSPYPPFTTLPDGRSLFLGYTYNFAKLPDAMRGAPRRPARRPLRQHGLGLLVGREVHGEDALS